METNRKETCADKVHAACDSRLESIRIMLSPEESDVTLYDDGTLDTVLYCDDEEFRLSADATMAYRDGDTGEMLYLDELIESEFDHIRETMYERFCEYGLSFDYVEPETSEGQSEGYLRYQISYGGPSEEIRFYVSPGPNRWHLYRAEFWYLDWFDGAMVDVTNNSIVQTLYDHFNDCESVHYAIAASIGEL